MRLQDKKRTFISLVAVGIFLISMINVGTAVPITQDSDSSSTIYSYHSSLPAQSGSESGTWVDWYQESNTTSDEWTWESNNWLFGPSPEFKIYHENGTELTSESYAEIDEVIKFVVTIPKDILQGVELGRVGFNGWYMTQDWNFSANFDFGYENWEFTDNPWWAWSNQYNISDTEGGPPLPSFVDIIPAQCSNTSDDNNYYVTLAIRFTSDAPLGLYELHMDITDREYNWIGSYGFGQAWEFQGIAVGIDPEDAWSYSYGGSYTLQKLDMEGDDVYSVSRGTDFIMRFNITGDPIYAMLTFNMPGGMEVLVNRTGWHTEMQTHTGGWVFNKTLNTYVYDATAQITSFVEVYGTYQAREWADLGQWQEVNVTVMHDYWDDGQQKWVQELVNETQWVEKKMFYIYNVSTDSFDHYYGYTYWGYPYDTLQPDTWNEEIYVFEPIPSDYPILYELNTTASSGAVIGNELVVDFVGHFTDKMPKTDQYSYFYFDTRVMGQDYEYWPDTWGDRSRQTQQEYEMARQIVIESPVTIAKLLKSDGTQPNGWMFQVNHDEQFMVKGRLQGGSDIADDIDGVSFRMEAFDSFWSEDFNRWSNLQFIIDIAADGSTTLKAYNMTQMNNYTYGTYWDYVLTNKTGWYYEYNVTTNSWDWVYGDYQEWEWKEVEGWHWQDWYFNQLTQEWQKDWIEFRSEETVVSPNFGTVSSFTNWTEGGDLFASFFFTPNSNMPETNYWWDFAFMNNTWYEDYSSGWGEHEIEDWALEWVYSFDYPPTGERVMLDEFDDYKPAYDFVNGTLDGNTSRAEIAPYIIIDGEQLPISVHKNYDPWSSSTWTTLFLFDHYDPATEKDVYFYELTNGTKVFVTYNESFRIYNATTSSGDSFLTAQEYPEYYTDGSNYYAAWMDLNGGIHAGPESIYGMGQLANWSFYDQAPVGDIHGPGPIHRYLVYGSSFQSLEVTEFWWSSRDSSYFMTTSSGDLIQMVYNSALGGYEIYIDGAWQSCSWPREFHISEYMGSDSYFATYETSRYWYTEVGDVDYEMPFPEANAQWQWQLDTVEEEGGLVPTTDSLIWEGIAYPVKDAGSYLFTEINGEVMQVVSTNHMYARANGTDIWYPIQDGFTGDVGTYNGDLIFTKLETIEYNNKTNDPHPQFYDGINELMELNNGTDWLVQQCYVFTVFEYEYNGSSFYSTQEWPAFVEVGNDSWYEYKAVNGTTYQFDDWFLPPVLSTIAVSTFFNNSGPTGYYFDFDGQTYVYNYEGQSRIAYKVLNATYSGELFFFWDNGMMSAHPILEFDYDGYWVRATANQEYIKRLRIRWGNALVYGLQPIQSTVYKNYHEFVIGTPEWGMWGIKNWAINEDNGALDLDGDFDTTEDQYYIREEYSSKDSWTHEYDKMWVNLLWDPNTTLYGDDMNVWSWLGIDTFTWSYEWNQTFYWYHASNFSQLTSSQMQDVKDQLISPEGEPMPGYWDIAWMAKNVTWQDIIDEAIANGWDWITSNEQSWTWLSFGISQNYGTSYTDGEVEHWLNIGMHYEFSGLMVWEDENDDGLMQVDLSNPGSAELTHYLIPDSISSLEFVTPGAAYGNLNESGSIQRAIDDEITWGVSFYDVNGTVFPFTTYGYWGWYDGVITGTDLRTFDERPTDITIDELSFLVHFQGHLNTTEGAENNYAEIKVDNYVGNWDVDMTGGRSNLVNRSLALNYFADVSLSDFAFKANGSFADGESTVGSDVFEFETAGARFAEMIMGGVTYDWGKNTTAPYEVVSMTTPVGTFRQAYESESGQSAVGWSSTSSMFYVTIGFPYWDGYSVMQDPVFVSYTSSRGTSAPIGAVTFGTFSISPTVPQPNEPVTVSVDIFAQEPITGVYLEYSTDLTNWEQTSMWNSGGDTWSGEIPGYPDDTIVYFRVVVETASGFTTSQVGSYQVGTGLITTGPTTPTGPIGGGEGIPVEMLVMIAGIAVVVIVALILVKRRR